MRFAIGMTTAPRPAAPCVERSYASLLAAGFAEPVHLFMEPDSPFIHPESDPRGVILHHSEKRLGCFPNWKRALTWLVKNTDADFLFVVQDGAPVGILHVHDMLRAGVI